MQFMRLFLLCFGERYPLCNKEYVVFVTCLHKRNSMNRQVNSYQPSVSPIFSSLI